MVEMHINLMFLKRPKISTIMAMNKAEYIGKNNGRVKCDIYARLLPFRRQLSLVDSHFEIAISLKLKNKKIVLLTETQDTLFHLTWLLPCLSCFVWKAREDHFYARTTSTDKTEQEKQRREKSISVDVLFKKRIPRQSRMMMAQYRITGSFYMKEMSPKIGRKRQNRLKQETCVDSAHQSVKRESASLVLPS